MSQTGYIQVGVAERAIVMEEFLKCVNALRRFLLTDLLVRSGKAKLQNARANSLSELGIVIHEPDNIRRRLYTHLALRPIAGLLPKNTASREKFVALKERYDELHRVLSVD